MKGDDKVIDFLNKALRSELTAVNQYWLHYRLQEDWGYGKNAAKSREESIEEMHHADKLIERFIFLEGHPNLQKLDPLRIGQTLKETLDADLAAEHEARTLYIEARDHCDSVSDYVTKNLFEELIADEEGHIDYLETQLDLIAKLGEEKYGLLNATTADAAEECAVAALPRRVAAPIPSGSEQGYPAGPLRPPAGDQHRPGSRECRDAPASRPVPVAPAGPPFPP